MTSRRQRPERSSSDASFASGAGGSEREERRRAREEEKRRVSRSRRKAILVLVGVVVLVLGAVAVVFFTPVLSVRNIDVVGEGSVPRQQIVAELGVPLGIRLVDVDAGAAAQRVAAIPALASVRVQRVYPSTVKVTVTERVPAVFIDTPDGTHLLDSEGVDFAASAPAPGLPRLVTEDPGFDDPATESALAVLTSMSPALKTQVTEVRADSVSDVSLLLADGRTLIWGDSGNAERKSAVALALLSQPGQILDVSSPDLPTTK